MSFTADGKPDLVRRLKQDAYAKSEVAAVDVEATDEWQAAIEIEAWRSVMPQFYFDPSTNGVFRRPETLPPRNGQYDNAPTDPHHGGKIWKP